MYYDINSIINIEVTAADSQYITSIYTYTPLWVASGIYIHRKRKHWQQKFTGRAKAEAMKGD